MSDDKPIILYPFRRRDPLSGKWYRARYKVSEEQLAQHEGEWIVDGPPEIRRALGPTSAFQPRPPARDVCSFIRSARRHRRSTSWSDFWRLPSCVAT